MNESIEKMAMELLESIFDEQLEHDSEVSDQLVVGLWEIIKLDNTRAREDGWKPGEWNGALGLAMKLWDYGKLGE